VSSKAARLASSIVPAMAGIDTLVVITLPLPSPPGPKIVRLRVEATLPGCPEFERLKLRSKPPFCGTNFLSLFENW
jgi:hypothetical protein